MWCGTFWCPNGTWCERMASMTRPAVSWTRPRTGSGSGWTAGRCGSAAQVLGQPADVGGQAAVLLRRLADGSRPGRAHHAEQQGGIDRAGRDIGVPVPARAELVPGVVAVHQVD